MASGVVNEFIEKINGFQKHMETIENHGIRVVALLIDDDHTSRMAHSHLMQMYEFETLLVESASQALDLIRSGQKFDVILMDMDMPIMNGIQTTREIRAMEVNSLIIGVEVYGTRFDMRELLEAGIDRLYEKPLGDYVVALLYQELLNNKLNE